MNTPERYVFHSGNWKAATVTGEHRTIKSGRTVGRGRSGKIL